MCWRHLDGKLKKEISIKENLMKFSWQGNQTVQIVSNTNHYLQWFLQMYPIFFCVGLFIKNSIYVHSEKEFTWPFYGRD